MTLSLKITIDSDADDPLLDAIDLLNDLVDELADSQSLIVAPLQIRLDSDTGQLRLNQIVDLAATKAAWQDLYTGPGPGID
jgi:hypothetical protein